MGRRWVAALILVLLAVPAAAQVSLPRLFVVEETLRGSDEETLRWPVAVAAASADEFAVADAFEPRVFLFRRGGVSWRLDVVAPLPAAPAGLVHDGGRYLVSLRGDGGLVALEGPRLLARKIGLPRDVVPGPLAARDGGGIWVFDYAGGRVLGLERDGSLEREIAVAERVTALAARSGGGLYAAVADRAAVLRFDASGGREEPWILPGDGPVPAWPVSLVAEPAGGLVLIDRHGARLLVLDDAGEPVGSGARKGMEPGLLRFPSAVARLTDGRYVVADEGNGRAQIFRRTDRGAAR